MKTPKIAESPDITLLDHIDLFSKRDGKMHHQQSVNAIFQSQHNDS